MTNALTTALLQHATDLVLAVLLGIFLRYAAPYLRAKTEAENLATLKAKVKEAVDAAEERFVGEKLGPTVRKPWVKDLLEGAGYVLDDLIDAMIDSAARALRTTTTIAEAAAAEAVQDATGGRVTKEDALATVDAFEGAITGSAAAEEGTA